MSLFEIGKKFLVKYPGVEKIASKVFNFIALTRIHVDKTTQMDYQTSFLRNCKINIKGKNNSITFGHHCYLNHSSITVTGNNNRIVLGSQVCLHETELYIEDNDGAISIGDDTLICGSTHLAVIEGCQIKIGKSCLLSKDITFRTGDSHSILDLNGNRINQSEDINLGDRVWVGNKVIVLKGAMVQDDSIISTGAILTQKIEQSNVIIGGVPARIIKENIKWDRRRI